MRTMLLHDNASGRPAFAAVTPADAAGSTSGTGSFCVLAMAIAQQVRTITAG